MKTLKKLRRELKRARKAVDKDNEYWERLACGQDTEQAENSGELTGYVDGLKFAIDLLEKEVA